MELCFPISDSFWSALTCKRFGVRQLRTKAATSRRSPSALFATITDVLVRVHTSDGRQTTTLIHPSQPWIEIQASQSRAAAMGTFVWQGIRYISFGGTICCLFWDCQRDRRT